MPSLAIYALIIINKIKTLEENLEMNHRLLRAIFLSLFLCCYLGVAGCVTTSGPAATAPAATTPSYNAPSQSDPDFWNMWESEHGLG